MNPDDLDAGLLRATDSLDGIARALRALGNADASTPMGGLEAHGLAIRQSLDRLTSAADGIADAIRAAGADVGAALEAVAQALSRKAT